MIVARSSAANPAAAAAGTCTSIPVAAAVAAVAAASIPAAIPAAAGTHASIPAAAAAACEICLCQTWIWEVSLLFVRASKRCCCCCWTTL